MQVPPNLGNFYDHFLRLAVAKSPSGSALVLLNIVLSSVRSLHYSELAVLLAVDSSNNSLGDVRRNYVINNVQAIQEVLGPLVKSHDCRIQLV